MSGCPWLSPVLLFERACTAKKLLACLPCQFTYDIPITRQKDDSVSGREALHLAGSHSYLPGLLKMSFPIKVRGILKVTCNVVTYASCQQTKQRAGTSLSVLLQIFFPTFTAQSW